MLLKLFLAFTIIPAVELYLLIIIGTYVGPLTTVAIILISGMIGAWLAKREGVLVLRQLAEGLSKGIPPASKLAEGGLVVAGALLLITPGVLTDLTGFAFIIPPTRRLVAPVLVRWLGRQFTLKFHDGTEESAFAGTVTPEKRFTDPQDLPFDRPEPADGE